MHRFDYIIVSVVHLWFVHSVPSIALAIFAEATMELSLHSEDRPTLRRSRSVANPSLGSADYTAMLSTFSQVSKENC